jgi:hypothetical protein
MFEPAAITGGPSGLADWPRPFVFRARHLDGLTLAPGAEFHFDVNLFDTGVQATAYLIRAFAELAREGLGPGRRTVELARVLQLPSPLELSLAREKEPLSRLCVRFVTPTELKRGQQVATEPVFGVLAARIRDRISTLRQLYGPGPLDMDFRAFGERASRVRMTHCELRRFDVKRRSSRTGQVHPIGGFVGEAEYEGDLAEFVPYLRAAKWTGVGRQTVWGKGEIEVLNPASGEVIDNLAALYR